MDLGITGRVALVGGATRGIGRAVAAALVAEGARVAITARDAARTAAAADELGAAAGYGWNSGDLDAAPELLARVEDELGPVEILVTNTGGPPANPDPLAFTPDQWSAAHRVLVESPITLVELVVPGMRARGWGRILNIGSTTTREPVASLMLSNAERSATLAAFKTLARELAGDGITLNTLLPGRIATERMTETHGSLRVAEAAAVREVPAGRLGRPEEMGAAAAFLCSQPAAYITGAALALDGGLLRAT